MNLDQIAKEYEDYKDGLYHTAYILDPFYSQICDHFQFLISIHNDRDTLTSTIKNVLKLSDPITESEANNYYENIQGIFFMVSVLWPLQLSLSYIESQGKNAMESLLMDNSNINTNVFSARSLYDLIIHLPESIVLPLLQDICEKNDSFSLIDAYQSNNAEDFINAFEKQKDKMDIIDAFVSKARKTELINNAIESLNPNANWTIWDFFRLSQKSLLLTCQEPGLELAYRIAQNPQRFLFADPKLLEQEAKQAYKSALMKYLSKKGMFDEYEKSIIEGIIQDQNFIALTNELLDECRKEKEQGCLNDENGGANGENGIIPLPFTTSVTIDTNDRIMFLTELYDKLVDKRYVDSNKCDDFVFLLGGGSKCPKDLAPIKWLKQKNQLQAFCSVYLNKDTNIEWSTLNSYFTWKGGSPKLSNSCGVIPKNFKTNFLAIFEECKTKILKQD